MDQKELPPGGTRRFIFGADIPFPGVYNGNRIWQTGSLPDRSPACAWPGAHIADPLATVWYWLTLVRTLGYVTSGIIWLEEAHFLYQNCPTFFPLAWIIRLLILLAIGGADQPLWIWESWPRWPI